MVVRAEKKSLRDYSVGCGYTKSEEKVSQIPDCNCPSPFKSSILKLSVSHGSEKQPEPAD